MSNLNCTNIHSLATLFTEKSPFRSLHAKPLECKKFVLACACFSFIEMMPPDREEPSHLLAASEPNLELSLLESLTRF